MDDSLERLPRDIARHLREHTQLYRRDPEAAHIWDSSVIGTPGPIATLLLTTRGRKTGKERYAPLQYFQPDGLPEGHFVVVGSMGGLPTHPGWYFNLRANPDCDVHIGAAHSRARARITTGEERQRLWKAACGVQPKFIKFQSWTTRELPVVVLELAG